MRQVTASISLETVKRALGLARTQYKLARQLEHAYTLLTSLWANHGVKLCVEFVQYVDALPPRPKGATDPSTLDTAVHKLLCGLIDRENGAAADAMTRIADLEDQERQLAALAALRPPACMPGGFTPSGLTA